MSMLEMQRALSRILTDSDFRIVFLDNPAAAARTYELTPREYESLSRLNTDVVEKYAKLLQDGRIWLALHAFPHTRTLVSSDIHRFVVRYCQENPPNPTAISPMFHEAETLYKFLVKMIDTGEIKSKYLREVLEYEKHLFCIANDTNASASAREFGEANESLPKDFDRDAVAGLKPLKGAHAEAVTFEHNILEILPLVDSGDLPDFAEQETIVLFFKNPNEVRVKTNKVNAATRDLLNQCNGVMTTIEVCDQLAAHYGIKTEQGREKLAGSIHAMLRQLTERSIISFVS